MSKSAQPPSIVPGLYRHYKGNLYEVLHLARHSETEEWLVVYRPCYGDNQMQASIWVRPAEMFSELVEIDGKKLARFSYLDN